MMASSKTALTIALAAGLLVSVSACGKRGDPVRPADVPAASADASS